MSARFSFDTSNRESYSLYRHFFRGFTDDFIVNNYVRRHGAHANATGEEKRKLPVSRGFSSFDFEFTLNRLHNFFDSSHVAGSPQASCNYVFAWLGKFEQAVKRCHAEDAARRKMKRLGNVHQEVLTEVSVDFLGFVENFEKGAFLE